ncbi:hypothetical protein AX760_10730 [Pararhizobium antarcticum]|uniref:Uncharacterized protein n=1 Tax=Pararhizobium antarcticum TaxID=1798805 RepID=A0A657LY26_9HYPH|nr:hypothetical protein AX760_10730 [Pararhizobium antarcticum]OJG00826.1 hypothetical protein AX761_07835 [Rhizobium sp. 58]
MGRERSNEGSRGRERGETGGANEGRLRIKVSLRAGIQVKNDRVPNRKNDVAQAAYAFAASLLLDRVVITLFRYVALWCFDMFNLR